MVLKDKNGEGTPSGAANPLSTNTDPSPFPPEISVHIVQRYLSSQLKQGEQWGICFEGIECTTYTEPALELLTLTNVLPSMMHVQYITGDMVLSPLLCQWAEQIFVCQVKGHATAMAISKHIRYGPIMLPNIHSILLHNALFARHTIHMHPTSWENQTPFYANSKMKTIKKFLGKAVQVPTRIRDVLHRFTDQISFPVQTKSKPADLTVSGLQVLCLNAHVSVQSKVRALHAAIKQTGFPAVLMLQEIGKLPDAFIFHPLYASFYQPPGRNSAGICILV